MATALHALSEVAFGLEGTGTPGTIVAADTGLVVDNGLASYEEIIERQVREAPRAVLAEFEDIVTRKESRLVVPQDLTFEEAPLPWLCGLKRVTGGAGPTDYTYTVLPSMTAPDALNSLSVEVFGTDGSTQHYKRKFGYGTCSEFTLELAFGQPAKQTATYFGRAGQALASPASPAVLTGRELVQSELFKLYVDDNWAGLGGTQVTTVIRSARLRIDTGVRPNYTLDGRSDLDFTGLRRGMLGAELEVVAELDATIGLEWADYQAGTQRFFSLEAAGTSNRAIKYQLAAAYVEPPSFSDEDGLVVVTLRARGRYDQTSGNLLNLEVTNQVSAY